MSIENSHRLKQLQSRRSKLLVELEQTGQELKRHQARKDELAQTLASVEGQIKNLTESGPVVSEHAILRYLQRVKGVDIDSVRREIMSERTAEVINTLDSCQRLPIGDGVALVVENRRVVSVIDDHGKRAGKKSKRRAGGRPMTEHEEMAQEIAYAEQMCASGARADSVA